MMSVFDATSQCTKGKQLVHPHCNKNDAQKLCAECSHHCLHSGIADDECDEADVFLHTTMASTWAGSMFDCIHCLMEQMHSHNDKSDTPHIDKVMQKHLEKAVAAAPELKAIKTTVTQLNMDISIH